MPVKEDLEAAHKRSIHHRAEIEASERCGCFHCLALFSPDEIEDWVDEPEDDGPGDTALCPRCGIDSVLAETSRYPLTFDFLDRMERRWFGLLSVEERAQRQQAAD